MALVCYYWVSSRVPSPALTYKLLFDGRVKHCMVGPQSNAVTNEW